MKLHDKTGAIERRLYMKPRADRVAIGIGGLGIGMIGMLIALQLPLHLEAWRFQRSRKLETILPDSTLSAASWDGLNAPTLTRFIHETDWSWNYDPRLCFCFLASLSRLPVICSSMEPGLASKVQTGDRL